MEPNPAAAVGSTGPGLDPASRPRRAYAGLVTRLTALGVDVLLLGLFVPAVGAGVPALWGVITGGIPRWLRDGAEVTAGLIPLAYFWLSWWVLGRTLGGLLLDTEVRRLDGRRIGAGWALLRAFFGLLVAPLWLVGMAVILWDPRRRALHDLVMRTVVRRHPIG